MSTLDDDTELRRLRWRCRRGMRELDRLLERWLEREWRQSPADERAVFLRLLDSEDDRLWKWFLGHAQPDDPEVAALVRRIADLPH
jgi:antitoxin CptB